MLHYLPVEGRHRRVTFFFAFFARSHLRAMSVSNVTQRGRRNKTHIVRTGCLIGAADGRDARAVRTAARDPAYAFAQRGAPTLFRGNSLTKAMSQMCHASRTCINFPLPPSDRLSERAAMSASREDGVAMSAHTGKTAPRRTERVRTVNILSARRCAHERFLRRAVRKGRGGESKGAEGRLRRGRISFDKITQYTLKPLTARTAFNIIILTTRV